MEEKIIKLINKLENILIKDKRFDNDTHFKLKVKKMNDVKKDKELNSNKPIDVSVLFNLAKLSQIPTPIKETVYVNNNNNFNLNEHMTFLNSMNTLLKTITKNVKIRNA